MSREVHEIPPAPRIVRWRAVLWYRWPLGFAGLFMTVYFGLFALMLFHARGGKPQDDTKLDASPHRTRGTVITVETTTATLEGAPMDLVTYRFTLPGQPDADESRCYLPAGRVTAGAQVDVVYVADETHINRIVDGRISLLGDWLTPVLGLLVAPGLLCGLLWLQGVHSLGNLLRYGDIAAAEVTQVQAVRFVLPTMLAVSYRFRDHHAQPCQGKHWVRRRSALGERLQVRSRRVAVVHGRRRATHSRLVMASDFVPLSVPPPNGGIPLEV